MNLSKIGEIEFSATTEENVSYTSEVTDRPVENLGYISDHVKPKPVTFSIEGIVASENAFEKLRTLREYCKGKQVYKYFGRNIFSNVVIESLSTSHSKQIKNGFSFKMSCKIIKRANSKELKKQSSDPAGGKGQKATTTQTKKVSSKGIQTKRKKTVDKQKKNFAAEKYSRKMMQAKKDVEMSKRVDLYIERQKEISTSSAVGVTRRRAFE